MWIVRILGHPLHTYSWRGNENQWSYLRGQEEEWLLAGRTASKYRTFKTGRSISNIYLLWFLSHLKTLYQTVKTKMGLLLRTWCWLPPSVQLSVFCTGAERKSWKKLDPKSVKMKHSQMGSFEALTLRKQPRRDFCSKEQAVCSALNFCHCFFSTTIRSKKVLGSPFPTLNLEKALTLRNFLLNFPFFLNFPFYVRSVLSHQPDRSSVFSAATERYYTISYQCTVTRATLDYLALEVQSL